MLVRKYISPVPKSAEAKALEDLGESSRWPGGAPAMVATLPAGIFAPVPVKRSRGGGGGEVWAFDGSRRCLEAKEDEGRESDLHVGVEPLLSLCRELCFDFCEHPKQVGWQAADRYFSSPTNETNKTQKAKAFAKEFGYFAIVSVCPIHPSNFTSLSAKRTHPVFIA